MEVRGLAVLLAGGAAWTIATGSFPLARPGRAMTLRPLPVSAVLLSVAAAALGAFSAFVLSGIAAVGLAGGVMASIAPMSWIRRRAASAEMARLEMWPDILTQVRATLASGSTLADALIDALDRSGGEFTNMASVMRSEAAFGGGFGAAVTRLLADGPDATSRRVLVTLSAASETGGGRVAEIVAVLARSVADELRLRRAHDAALTEQRLTVSVALVAPWAMLVLAIATNPQAEEAFSTPTGAVVVMIGVVTTVSGWALSTRAARLSRPPAVFR
jgi:tight adherence protein B